MFIYVMRVCEKHRHCRVVTDSALDKGLYENFGSNDCSTEERKTRQNFCVFHLNN